MINQRKSFQLKSIIPVSFVNIFWKQEQMIAF